jgi:SAM-dependent methyltransferase
VSELPATTEQAYREAIDRWNRSPHGDAFPEWDRPVRRRQLALLLAHTEPGALIVDIGTGTGVVPAAILASGRRLLTIDIPGGNDAVAAWIRKHGGTTATAVVGPEPIPLELDAAATVLLADVIEHLPGSPLPLLGEIARVLRPGGVLVLSTPNATRLHVRVKVALGRSNWPPLGVVYGEHEVHPSHHREYTRAEVVEVLDRAGFIAVETEFIEERVPGRWPNVAGRLAAQALSTLAPSLAGDLVAVARRPDERRT